MHIKYVIPLFTSGEFKGKLKKLIIQYINKLIITPILLSCKKLWKKYAKLKISNPNRKKIKNK